MTALCGLVTSYWQLLAARIGIAIGEGGTNPPSHSIISDLYPISRPRPTRQPDRSSPAAGDPGAIATP